MAEGGDRRLLARTILIAGLVALCVSVVAGIQCQNCTEPDCKKNSVCNASFCSYIEKNDTRGTHSISYRCTDYDDIQYPGLGDGPADHMGKCIKGEHKGISFAMKICNDTDLCNTIDCALVEPDAGSGGGGPNNTAAAVPSALYGAAAVALLSLMAVA